MTITLEQLKEDAQKWHEEADNLSKVIKRLRRLLAADCLDHELVDLINTVKVLRNRSEAAAGSIEFQIRACGGPCSV